MRERIQTLSQMQQGKRYKRFQLIVGCISLLIGFLAASVALFYWAERAGTVFILGSYSRSVCGIAGLVAVTVGAMTIHENSSRDSEIKRICSISLRAWIIILVVQPTVVYCLVSYSATVTVTPLGWLTAFVSYRSNTGTSLLNSPKGRSWNGSAWDTTETEMPTAGSAVIWFRTAYCTTSARYYERIVVTLGVDNYLDAYIWNGAAWQATSNIGLIDSGASIYQSFDIAYEKTSGNALLVYALSSSNASRDLAYRIWDGSNWSVEKYIDDTGHANALNYRWIELESKPTESSNEIALIAVDNTNADCNAWLWNNGAWGNFRELENSLSSVRDDKCMGVAYEKNSGKAMFVWCYSGYVESRKWNGVGWEDELPGISLSTLNVRWISLKADPASNNLMLVALDSQSDLNSVYWDGNAWGLPVEHDVDVTHADRRCYDFEWEPSGSKGLLVWSTNQGSVSYKTFTAPSTWSSESTVSNSGTHPWIQLRKNSRDGGLKIIGATLNSNSDLYGFRWNGSTLTFETTAFTTDTVIVSYECFDIAFQSSNN